MYKEIITTVSMLLLSVCTFAQETAFVLSSQIDNLEGKVAYVTIWDGTSTMKNKTIPVVDGQFNYSETTASPLVIRVSATNPSVLKKPDPDKTGAYPTKAASMWCVVQPGEKVKLVGRLTDYAEISAAGGAENEVCNKILKSYFPLLNKQMNLQVKLARASSSAADQAELKKEFDAASQAALDALKKMVSQNSSSIMGLYLINDLMLRGQLSIPEAANLIKTVDNSYKKTEFYKLVASRISAGRYVVGAKMLTITGTLPNGKAFSNTSLSGKYYLIDFWGTWCVPCMAGMPHLLDLKKKYAGKLEILGIDKGDTEEKWRTAIAEKGLDWYHIMSGSGTYDYVAQLNVTGFPTTILVGPDGTILYRSLGISEDLNDKLDKYLSAKQ